MNWIWSIEADMVDGLVIFLSSYGAMNMSVGIHFLSTSQEIWNSKKYYLVEEPEVGVFHYD